MKITPKIDKESAELIDKWQLGDLDDESRLRLVERLEQDPSARRAFLDATMMEAMLHLEYPDSVVHFPQRQCPWYRRSTTWLAAAASVAIATGLWFMLPGFGSNRTMTPVAASSEPGSNELRGGGRLIESSPIASVVSMSETIFEKDSIPLEEGTLVSPGTIDLKSGRLELSFFSGARVTLEGPCSFQLKSDFRATLLHGRLTADVPPQAIGFTIHTPSGQLRDLGTAFAVSVGRNGDADVHVFDGIVEVGPINSTSLIRLTSNQASRISGGKLTAIEFIADGWPNRPKNPASALPKFVHWPLDRFDMDESLDSSGVHKLWMRNSGESASNPSERLRSGVKGQALSFNGVNEYAESTYRGISGNKPRSVAFWVQIPPDASHTYPNGIISWGSHQQARKWQICWNNGDQGTVGALRVEFGDGYLIGTTDLRDGLWHHLSVVFLGGDGSDVGSHVKLYVDGKLETSSGRRSQFIRTDTNSPQAIGVTLGRWLGNWPGGEPFHFQGSVDEIFIFEGALTPAEVTKLAERNR